MEYKEISKYILSKSKGILDEAEVFIVTNKNLSIETFQGEISSYEIAETGGLSLRGLYNGNMGYSYTEKIDKSVADELINNVVESSKYLEGEKEFIYEGESKYNKTAKNDNNFKDIDIKDKISYLLELEKEMESLDKRVSEKMTYYSEFEGERYIMNTKGLNLEDSFYGGVVSANAIIKDGNETKTGSSYSRFKDITKLVDIKTIANEAVEDGISKLGASNIKTGNYPVVIENETFSSLLASFSSIFNSEAIQKNFSLLKGKIGERIASPLVNLVDDPFIEEGFGSQDFDDEGVACKFKEIIEDGILKEFLYNLKTGNKEGRASTGNASRSYKGGLGISPTNLYLVAGDTSKEEILENGNGGIYINSLQGLHSGLNPTSGDFSLSAEGFLIEDGKLSKPVNQITIAGNFFSLLKDIISIGDDFKFGSGGRVGSPSVLIKELSVSGE